MKEKRARKRSGEEAGGDPSSRGSEADIDKDLVEWFRLRFIGMVAEADLRGMTPVAVFFELLDQLAENRPEQASAVVDLLPIDTRVEYRRWREGRSITNAQDDGCEAGP